MTESPLLRKRLRKIKAEELRLRALYREFALSGGLRLPREALALLIGPDTAYRSYGKSSSTEK